MKTYKQDKKDTILTHSGECDLCDQKDLNVLYDARMLVTGQWAFCCEDCFMDQCVGLGIGKGQKYKEVQD